MGNGFYLGQSRYSRTEGWSINKEYAKSLGNDTFFANDDAFTDNAKGINTAVYEPKVTQSSDDNGGRFFEITHNTKQNGTEVRFISKPSDEVLGYLKSIGFRWGKFNKTWWIKGYSEKTVKELNDYLSPPENKKISPEVQAEWLYGQFQILADDALRTTL